MRAGSVITRSGRSVPRAGAVVVVLLATLLHLLGCCHGPAAAEALRTDALSQVAPGSHGPRPADWHRDTTSGPGTAGRSAYGQGTDEQSTAGESTAGQGTPASDEDAHCCALDEPTVQPPRHPRPTGPPLPDLVLPDPPGPAAAAPSSAHHHSPAVPAESSAGHGRALLGVWRT
ncbi:hypothetical protein [Streptomyces sp. NPDC001153]